jgi:hypothetical protein
MSVPRGWVPSVPSQATGPRPAQVRDRVQCTPLRFVSGCEFQGTPSASSTLGSTSHQHLGLTLPRGKHLYALSPLRAQAMGSLMTMPRQDTSRPRCLTPHYLHVTRTVQTGIRPDTFLTRCLTPHYLHVARATETGPWQK